MKTRRRVREGCAALAMVLGLLAGCGGGPPPPDWKLNAHAGLETHAKLWLDGNSRLAEVNLNRARTEIARTGRLDLAARAELAHCAVRAAALDFSPCQAFELLRAHAAAADLAYARFLAGDWRDLDPQALPPAYAGLLKAGEDGGRQAALDGIKDPLSRLIGAATLLRAGQLAPAGIATATATASDQGWRRPLLAWLEVQRQRAETAGDGPALETLRQRIRLVEQSLPGS